MGGPSAIHRNAEENKTPSVPSDDVEKKPAPERRISDEEDDDDDEDDEDDVKEKFGIWEVLEPPPNMEGYGESTGISNEDARAFEKKWKLAMDFYKKKKAEGMSSADTAKKIYYGELKLPS